MNYTETYRKLYASIKIEDTPHEVAHRASLRIADAISYLYLTSKTYNEETMEVVKEAVSGLKIGGYDLDDRGQLIGFGTSATGLNNNK